MYSFKDEQFKDYIFLPQGLEEKERATAERKSQLKAAVDEGKKIPTELKKDAVSLQKEIDLDGKQFLFNFQT